MLQEKQLKREAAYKISAAEILNGSFQQDEIGSAALNIGGRLVKRVNLLATVISKSEGEGQAYRSMMVDDGTAQLKLRFFDQNGLFEKADVGDFITIIGKPRSYGGDAYIAPEIIKPNKDVKWAEARRLELELATRTRQKTAQPVASTGIAANKATAVDSEDVVSREKIKLYSLIKQLDTGKGADVGEVVNKSGIKDANKVLEEMTKKGDVFEVLPGRLKVLE